MIRRTGLALVAAAIGLATGAVAALADPLEDAITVYQAGNFDATVGLLLPLAEGGDPVAQWYLAYAYSEGQGVC